VGFRPDVRLILSDPVRLGFFPEAANGLLQAGKLEQPAPGAFHRPVYPGMPLIQPDNSGPQGLAFTIEVDHRAALRGDGHAHHLLGAGAGSLPELLASNAKVVPEVLRMLFCPSWLLGKVRLDFLLTLTQQIALGVEQQGADTLGAVVDRQYQWGLRHFGHPRPSAVDTPYGRLSGTALAPVASGHHPSRAGSGIGCGFQEVNWQPRQAG